MDNLGLCSATVAALKARGIQALFPIQKAVFQPAAEGRDLIGRAKTGSGKTLAFALPVVESLIKVRPGSEAELGRVDVLRRVGCCAACGRVADEDEASGLQTNQAG